MLDWMTPESEWEATREHVESEYGGIEGYLSRFVESAMKEYADKDGYQDVEAKIDRLVRAAGRTPDDINKEKISIELGSQPTVRVTVRVDESVKDWFKQAVDEHTDDVSYGEALARALRVKRNGGRAARLEDKLNRIVDDAEAILSELDSGEGADEGLSTVERRTIIICNRLDDQFTDDELVQEISDVAGASEPTIERYRERVIDRLGYEPHPMADETIWVPSDVAADLVPDGVPAEIRRPVHHLDRDERVRRIKLEIGRQATARDGRFSTTASEVREQVFKSEVSLSSVRDLLNQVALDDGFHLDKSADRTSIRVNVRGELSDEDLAQDIRDYVEADVDGMFDGATETTVSDWTTTESPETTTNPDGIGGGGDERSDAATDGGGDATTHAEPSRQGRSETVSDEEILDAVDDADASPLNNQPTYRDVADELPISHHRVKDRCADLLDDGLIETSKSSIIGERGKVTTLRRCDDAE